MKFILPNPRVEHAVAASASRLGSRSGWRIAATPGALILAALALSPVGSRLVEAAQNSVAAHLWSAGADWLADLPAADFTLKGVEHDSEHDVSIEDATKSGFRGRAAASLGEPRSIAAADAAPRTSASPPAPPVSDPGPGVVSDPPLVGDLPILDIPELPQVSEISELLDSVGDLGAPSVESVGEIVDQLVDDLPSDVLGDVVSALPADEIVETALSLPLVAGLTPGDLVASAPGTVQSATGAVDEVVNDALAMADGAVGELPVDALGDTVTDLGDTVADLGGVLDEGLGDTLGDGLADGLADGLGDGLADAGAGGLIGDLGGLP